MTHLQAPSIQAMVPKMGVQGSRKLLTICLGALQFSLLAGTHWSILQEWSQLRWGCQGSAQRHSQCTFAVASASTGHTARWCYWPLLPLEGQNSAFWVLIWSFSSKSSSSVSRQLCQSHFSIKQGNNKPAWSYSPVRHRVQLEVAKPSLGRTRGWKLLLKIFVKVLRFLKFITKKWY